MLQFHRDKFFEFRRLSENPVFSVVVDLSQDRKQLLCSFVGRITAVGFFVIDDILFINWGSGDEILLSDQKPARKLICLSETTWL